MGACTVCLVLCVFTVAQGFYVGSNWFLAQWSALSFGTDVWLYVWTFSALQISSVLLVTLRDFAILLAVCDRRVGIAAPLCTG